MPAPEVRGSSRARALSPLLRAAGLALCCSLLCFACGGSKAETTAPQRPAPPPGMPRARPTPTAILPPSGSSPDGRDTATENDRVAANSAPRFEMPPDRPSEPAPADPGVAKGRDYSAELSGLLKQSAASCLAGWSPSRNGSVSIQVTAQVMASGTVSRAEANASGLTPSILACVQKLASTVRLQGPIADAPRSVQTQLALQVQGAEAPPPKAAATNSEDERDENPRDSKLQEVANDPAEVIQKDEPDREAPEPPEPRELPPTDTHADEQP